MGQELNQSYMFFLFLLVAVIVGVIFALLSLAIFLLLFRHWIRAATSGAPVSVFSILGMRLRGSRVALVVDAYIVLKRSGSIASIGDVESIYIDNKIRARTSQDLVELVRSKIASEEPSASV